MGRLTGLAALINTSFNSKGKPIVNRALTKRALLEVFGIGAFQGHWPQICGRRIS